MGITGRTRCAYSMWPRRRSCVVNTVRFLIFATLVLPRRTFAERRRAVKSPAALPTRPHRHGVTAAVPRPAPLTEQLAPQDPRQDLTSGRVEPGQKRTGIACGICGPGCLQTSPKTTGPCVIWRSNGIRRAPSKGTYLESLKRSRFSLNVVTDTLYACLKTPRSSACNASSPHVPVPSSATCWQRHRRAEPGIVQVSPVHLERRQPQPGLLLPGMLVFHLFGVQSRDSRQGLDPLRPDLGAIHAGGCGIHVLPGQ